MVGWVTPSHPNDATLAEEKKTDEALTKLAQSKVNQHAQAA
jgi:ferritin-like metal-binding protein YciE